MKEAGAVMMPFVLLTLLAAGAALVSGQHLPTFKLQSLAPLNHRWAMTDMCQYGTLPGSFFKQLPINNTWGAADTARLNKFWVNHSVMSFDEHWDTADYGGRWKVFHPHCQLENLIKPILDYTAPKPPAESTKILIVSDSIDTHLLQWVGEHHHRKFGADSEQVKQLNYTHYLHDRGPTLNYIIGTSGLSLFHMFLLTLNGENPYHPKGSDDSYNPLMRVAKSRTFFDLRMQDATGIPTNQTRFEPDLIVLHCNYWSLYDMYWAAKRNDTVGFLLPMSFVESFISNFTAVAVATRALFPHSLIMARTASMIRHNYDTGGIVDGGRQWAHRMHVAQLNQAIRAAAHALWLPMMDEEVMTSGLTPRQALFDDIHLNQAVSFEVVNIWLNWIKQYKGEVQQQARRRSKSRRRARTRAAARRQQRRLQSESTERASREEEGRRLAEQRTALRRGLRTHAQAAVRGHAGRR